MGKELDLYCFLGSTYTYLTVNRVESFARQRGISLTWRPFSVRSIMVEQNNRPFVGKPVKLAYMWRDVERRAARHGIPFNGIPDYPNDPEELATRVALLAAKEGWCADFVKASYACWFLENKDPGDANNLSPLLARLGKEPDEVIATANSEKIRKEYRMTTEAARALGIFGSPTFVCGQEIFWGDDRLEDAIDWCLEP
jgi:2-hydroxychromene-2-carboxylate isomerase